MWEKVKTSNGPNKVTAAVISEYAACSISTPARAIFLSAGVDIPAVRRTWMAKSTSLRARLPISDMMFWASVDCEHSAYWMEPGKLQEMMNISKDGNKFKPMRNQLNQFLSQATYKPKETQKEYRVKPKHLTVANLLTSLLVHKMGSQQASLKNSWNILKHATIFCLTVSRWPHPTLISISKLLCLPDVASAFITVHLPATLVAQSRLGSTLQNWKLFTFLLTASWMQITKSTYHIALYRGKSLRL